MEEICQNCKHFFISGMFQSWGGKVGYCLLIQNNKIINERGFLKANPNAIKSEKDSCDKFQKRITIVKNNHL